MAVHPAFKECAKGQCLDAASHKQTRTKSIIKCDKPFPKNADPTVKDPCTSPCECTVFRRAKGAKADVVWDFVIPVDGEDIEDVAGFDYRCSCVEPDLPLPDGYSRGKGSCDRPKLLEQKTKIYCASGKCTADACHLFRLKHDKDKTQRVADGKAKWEHVDDGIDVKSAVKYDSDYYYICVCLKS